MFIEKDLDRWEGCQDLFVIHTNLFISLPTACTVYLQFFPITLIPYFH